MATKGGEAAVHSPERLLVLQPSGTFALATKLDLAEAERWTTTAELASLPITPGPVATRAQAEQRARRRRRLTHTVAGVWILVAIEMLQLVGGFVRPWSARQQDPATLALVAADAVVLLALPVASLQLSVAGFKFLMALTLLGTVPAALNGNIISFLLHLVLARLLREVRTSLPILMHERLLARRARERTRPTQGQTQTQQQQQQRDPQPGEPVLVAAAALAVEPETDVHLAPLAELPV